MILLEAAEIVGDDTDEVEAVVAALPHQKLMFELPGPWIAGVHHCDVHALRKDLIARFGANVNLANVDPDELIAVEAYRRQLGVNAGGPTGGRVPG